MQTFLPYKSFRESLQCLDYKRLGKQRVEAMQILNILEGKTTTKGWINHPAVKMWKGWEASLERYHNTAISLWIIKGFNNTMKPRYNFHKLISEPVIYPDWLTDDFCRAHQSNLLRKDFQHYSQYFKNVPDNLPYIWPI